MQAHTSVFLIIDRISVDVRMILLISAHRYRYEPRNKPHMVLQRHRSETHYLRNQTRYAWLAIYGTQMCTGNTRPNEPPKPASGQRAHLSTSVYACPAFGSVEVGNEGCCIRIYLVVGGRASGAAPLSGRECPHRDNGGTRMRSPEDQHIHRAS